MIVVELVAAGWAGSVALVWRDGSVDMKVCNTLETHSQQLMCHWARGTDLNKRGQFHTF